MIFHICKFKREDKDGIHLGGVEKFAMYLNRAIPELTKVSWPDYPQWTNKNALADFEKAQILNDWLLETGQLGKDSTVIVDGYWGRGLEGKVGRLISVCHGSYAGRLIQYMIYPWGENISNKEISEQEAIWRHEEVEVVSVSHESAREVAMIADKVSTVIRHGVDLDVYKPLGYERNCYMHAATSARKGIDVIDMMAKGFGTQVLAMGVKSGNMESEAKRLNQAIVLVAPSRHEGNTYLLNEAMACGTPVLTYATGFANELALKCGVVLDDLSPSAFKIALEKENWSAFDPRSWAEHFCDYETFAESWKEYIDEGSG